MFNIQRPHVFTQSPTAELFLRTDKEPEENDFEAEEGEEELSEEEDGRG